MDLLSSRTIDITKKAMDGLMERQRAIGANIANVMTPGYQRKEVSFENQLSEIIEREDLKDYIKGKNSIQYTPTSIEEVSGINLSPKGLSIQEKNFLKTNSYENFNPQIMDDVFSEGPIDGNNVELEKELIDLSKTGTKYTMLATLEKKQMAGMLEVIRGGSGV